MVSICLEVRQNKFSYFMRKRICTYLREPFQINIMFWHSIMYCQRASIIFWHSIMGSQRSSEGQVILAQMCIIHRTVVYAFSLQTNEETTRELQILHNRIFRTQKKLETCQREEPWQDSKKLSKINQFRNVRVTILVCLLHRFNYLTDCKAYKKNVCWHKMYASFSSTTYLQNTFHSNKYLVSYSQNACKISVKNNCFVLKNYSLQYQIS
jgi:hypothetical protein